MRKRRLRSDVKWYWVLRQKRRTMSWCATLLTQQFLTLQIVVSVKIYIVVVRVTTQCYLVEGYRCFEGENRFLLQDVQQTCTAQGPFENFQNLAGQEPIVNNRSTPCTKLPSPPPPPPPLLTTRWT